MTLWTQGVTVLLYIFTGEAGGPRFKFLHSSKEAVTAIRGILSADPRSVYRRTRCKDRLFYFTLDTADITCWFGPGFAEVLQVRPVKEPVSTTWGNLLLAALEVEKNAYYCKEPWVLSQGFIFITWLLIIYLHKYFLGFQVNTYIIEFKYSGIVWFKLWTITDK